MALVKDVFSVSLGDPLTLLYTAAEDDFMFLISSNQFGDNPPSTPSGWTVLSYNHADQGGGHNQIWYRKATASEPTSVSVTANPSNDRHSLQLVSFEGVDTTTPFDVTLTSRLSGATTSVTSAPSITPVTANSLIFYISVPNNQPMIATPGPITISSSGAPVISGEIKTYYTYSKGASVAVPAVDFYSQNAVSVNPTLVTIALRDDGGGKNAGYVDKDNPPADILHLLGLNGATGHITGTAKIDLSAIITTIQGITTTNNTGIFGNEAFSFESGFVAAGYSFTGGIAPSLLGDSVLIGTSTNVSYDIENDLISLSTTGPPELYAGLSSQAKSFAIGDGTNFRLFQIDAINTSPSGSELPLAAVLEVDGGFHTEEYGTVTAGVLQTIDTFAMSGPGQSKYIANSFGFLYRLRPMVLLGASTYRPLNMNVAVDCARTGSLRTVSSQSQQSQSQFIVAHPVVVGNGVIPTVWKSQQHAIESAAASSVSERRIQVQVSEGNFGHLFHASPACDFNFSVTTFNGGNFSPWGFVPGTSTSATYSEQGALIISHNPTLEPIGRPFVGMTFTGCKQLLINNAASISGGCNIDSCVDTNSITPLNGSTQGALQSLVDNIANCKFTNNNIAVRIEYTGATADITLNFDAIKNTGNTVDIHYNSTNVSTLTANMQNGSNASTSAVSGAAVAVVIANDVTATFAITPAGAELTVLVEGTTTELFHVETAGTSESYVYTYSSDFNGDIQVFKPGFKPVWLPANLFSSSDQTITVNLLAESASQI